MADDELKIGAYYIRGLLQGVLDRGIDPDEVLKEAGLATSFRSMTTDQHPTGARASTSFADLTINGRELQNLIMAIRTCLNDHYMGFLKVPGKLAMDLEVGRVAVRHSSLGEAIRELAAFVNAVRSDEERELVLDREKSEVSLVYRFQDFRPDVDPHLLYWFRLYWGYRFYNWLIGQRIPLSRVCFSSSRPPQSIDHERMFRCPVHFDQQHDSYSFPSHYLTEPVIRNEVELFSGDFPLKYPNWFTLPGRDQTLSSQVEQVMIELQREGMPSPSIQVIAGIMSLSARTLSRRLAREHTTFQTIKTCVRREASIKLLTGSDLPIARVAEQIGFAEPGDFTRAFSGWTGSTPSDYRNTQRQTAEVKVSRTVAGESESRGDEQYVASRNQTRTENNKGKSPSARFPIPA